MLERRMEEVMFQNKQVQEAAVNTCQSKSISNACCLLYCTSLKQVTKYSVLTSDKSLQVSDH